MESYVHQAIDPFIDVEEDGTSQKDNRQEWIDSQLTFGDLRVLTMLPRMTVDSIQVPGEEGHASYNKIYELIDINLLTQ